MQHLTQRFLAWLARNAQLRRERELESFLPQTADGAGLESRVPLLERSPLRRTSGFALRGSSRSRGARFGWDCPAVAAEDSGRTLVCSVLFSDIVGYSKTSVLDQFDI